MIRTAIQVLFLIFLLVPSQTLSGGSALRPLDPQTGGDVSQEKILEIISRVRTPIGNVYTPAFEELKKVGTGRDFSLARKAPNCRNIFR